MENEVAFGRLIKEKRMEKGMSLDSLAKACDIEKSYISRMERGERKNPGFAIVCSLANVLELDSQEVLGSFGYEQLGANNSSRIIREESISLSIDEQNKLNRIESLIYTYISNKEQSNGALPNIILLMEEIRESYQNRISR